MKILIVDDDLALCHIQQTHLELIGYESILL
jgi:DNA-binding response OmpR family regulator